MAQGAHIAYLTDPKRQQTSQLRLPAFALPCPQAGSAGPGEREGQAQRTDLQSLLTGAEVEAQSVTPCRVPFLELLSLGIPLVLGSLSQGPCGT